MGNFWFIFAGNQLRSVGKTLTQLGSAGATPGHESNAQMVGRVLDVAGVAVLALGAGDVKNFRGGMKTAADGIYTFLGLTPPTQTPQTPAQQ